VGPWGQRRRRVKSPRRRSASDAKGVGRENHKESQGGGGGGIRGTGVAAMRRKGKRGTPCGISFGGGRVSDKKIKPGCKKGEASFFREKQKGNLKNGGEGAPRGFERIQS